MAKKKEKKPKAKKQRNSGWGKQLLYIVSLLAAIVFMPSAIVMLFGMMPTIISAVFDVDKRKTKALTVGPVNFVGCTYFLLYLWDTGRSIENAVLIVTNPVSVVVMWGTASIGYMIYWAMSGIVGTVVAETAKGRAVSIKKSQEKMVERWGAEVTGELELDAYGFSVKKLVDDVDDDESLDE